MRTFQPPSAPVLHLVVVLAAAVGLLAGAAPALAQEGAVVGRVTDAGSGDPVSGAQVFVRGTGLGTLTGETGEYRIEGVPAGERTVRVRLIGYEAASRTVTVGAGERAEADFRIEQSALKLQELVVTGLPAETPRVKLPFTVEKVTADELPVPAGDVRGILQGKAPWITVVSASGAPGGASDILLRGQTSINAAGQGPLVIVDGVIQSTDATLADLSSLDIESIEVVKGAASASMYGARGQNGVIKIETKSGAELSRREESVDVTVRLERGRSDLPRTWPPPDFHVLRMNAEQTSLLAEDGTEFEFGDRAVQESACGGGAPRCFQDNPWPTVHDNFATFFDPGENVSLYGAIAGATGQTSVRLSGEYYGEEGTLLNNEGFDRFNGRVNVGHAVGEAFDLRASAFASRSSRDPLAGGNGGTQNTMGWLYNVSPMADIDQKRVGGRRRGETCTGGPAEDCWFVLDPSPTGSPGTGSPNPLFWEESLVNGEQRNRLMASVQATWSPLSWLSLDGTLSYDRTDREGETFRRRGTPQGGGGRAKGFLERSAFLQEALSTSLTADLRETWLDGELTTRAKARFLTEDQETETVFAHGEDFVVKGVRTLGALRNKAEFRINSNARTIRSQNVLLTGSLDYRDRYILGGLIRREGSSLFGPRERWHTYFRASGAYRLSEEPWFEVGPVTELKLRYSIGTAGSRPRFDQRFETFAIGEGGNLTFETLGNVGLEPELTTEQEAGVDLTLLDRVQVTATYAHSRTENQLLPVPLPGFFGFSTQWQNAGTLESDTWEGSLQAALLEGEAASWTAQLSAHTTTEVITELGVPSFKYGPTVQGGNVFFAREGESLGTFYGFDFVRDCGDLEATFGIGRSACRANFDVNDHGYLVFVGEGHTWRSGPGPDGEVQTSDDLWGTTGTVGGRSFEFGRPLVAERVDPLCLENDPEATREECTTDFLPLGSSNPDLNLSLSNDVRWRGFRLYALLDAELGFDIYNATAQGRSGPGSAGVGVDYRGSVPVGRPAGETKPLAYYNQWTYMGNANNDFFVEDGSFLKVRELAVSYELPDGALRALPWAGESLDAARVSLIGRNLLTLTGYRGHDPEVGFGRATGQTGATGSAANTRLAANQVPNFRTVSASLEITF